MDNKWNPEIHSISRHFVKKKTKKPWKLIYLGSQEYLDAKHNLKIYNGILNRYKIGKKGTAQQFEKYRCDTKRGIC